MSANALTQEDKEKIVRLEGIVTQIASINEKRKFFQLKKKSINDEIRQLKEYRDKISKRENLEVVIPMKLIIRDLSK